ncbi:MAG TPA: hypothetical protein VIG46_00885 [Candidatus Baltobacteraceae bacterium]
MQTTGMYPYFIGSGVLLEAGANAGSVPATLHAQTDAALAASVRAAAVDFEGVGQAEVARLLVVASGWTSSAVERTVMAPLRARGTATLADVLAALALAAGDGTVHLFSGWLPGPDLVEALAARAVTVIAHPLASFERAALITGQRSRSPLAA